MTADANAGRKGGPEHAPAPPPGRGARTFDNGGVAALLALTTVATVIGIDGTLPALPAMMAAFGADQAAVQLTLSSFMIGIAVGQLVHGPLSDRFGRKSMIVAGMALNVVAAAGCALASSIEMLVVFRFVHGIAAATGWIVSRAVVRDRFERGEAARVLSITMFFHGMAPLVASIVSAHLTVLYGWNAIFYFIAGYCTLVLATFVLLFRETLETPNRDALRLAPMIRNFAEVARSVPFWGYTACASASFGILFSYLGASSYVIITHFGETETAYGYMFAATMVGSTGGMLLVARLVGRFGVDPLLRFGVAWATLFGTVIAALALARVDHWLAVVGPMFFCMMSYAFIFPQALAGALQPFPHIAGTASSLVGFVQQLVGAATGMAVAGFSDGTQVPLALGVLVWAVFGLGAYAIVVRRHRTV